MVELFNNNPNKEMVFNVNAQGIDPAQVEVKMLLLMEGKATNLFFMADIVDGKVCFNLPALTELNEAQEGTLRLEVIADGEYFKPWESDFQIKAKRSFSVSSSVTETVATPNKKLSVVLETAPTKPAPIVEKAVIKPVAKAPVPAPKQVAKVVKENVATAQVPVVANEDPETLTFGAFIDSQK